MVDIITVVKNAIESWADKIGQEFKIPPDYIKNILYPQTINVSTNRKIGDITIFSRNDSCEWERMYDLVMDKKYKKKTRGFSKVKQGKVDETPKIYLIPRERGGPSYKKLNLVGAKAEDIHYCPISKGYSMQDVSSFTLGPIVGHGLCLVNASFSKQIGVKHIEGGGCVDYNRKNFWKKGKPQRIINIIDFYTMTVDEKLVNIQQWLEENKQLWFDEWLKWSRSVALCSKGDFHWNDDSKDVGYYVNGVYLTFPQWKKECYIKWSYELLPHTDVYQFLEELIKTRSIGLVHPKAISDAPEVPITKELLKELFDSEYEMCCQPYVVAGKLMGVKIECL